MHMPPTDEQWEPAPSRERPGPPNEPERAAPAPWKVLAATALVATVLGAGVGTAMTLLVGEPGPRGEQGERGAAGPRGSAGPAGPEADTSDLESAVDDLAARVEDLSLRVEDLESGSGSVSEDDIAELDGRLADLESLVSDLCFELDLIC